jgi:hypothetical protein
MRSSPRHRLSLPFAVGVLGLVMIAMSAATLIHDHHTPNDFGYIPATSTAPSTTIPHPHPSTTATGTTAPAAVTSSAPKTLLPPARTTVAGAHLTSNPAPIRPRPAHRGANGTVPGPGVEADDATVGIPLFLELPTLGVRAAIEPVATHQGVLTVPDDPASVGWWAGSSLPGSVSGRTVIDGHIDSASRGTGALWHLSALTAGEHIVVTTATHHVEYQVVARRIYPKNAGIPAEVFDTTGPPLLVLISCGGPFDANRGSYRDNIAVFATPTR